MTPLFDLTGKTAIVTGASGGIGQAIAVALAQAGARIAGVARSSQDETAQAVKAAGGDYLAIKADLASDRAGRAHSRRDDRAGPAAPTSWSTMPASSAAPIRSSSARRTGTTSSMSI